MQGKETSSWLKFVDLLNYHSTKLPNICLVAF